MKRIRNMLILLLFILTASENGLAQPPMRLEQVIIDNEAVTDETILRQHLTISRYDRDIDPWINMPLEKGDRIRTSDQAEVKLIIRNTKVFLNRGTYVMISHPNSIELIQGESFIDKLRRIKEAFSVKGGIAETMTEGTRFYVSLRQPDELPDVIVFDGRVRLAFEKYGKKPVYLDSSGNNAFLQGNIVSSHVSPLGYEAFQRKIQSRSLGGSNSGYYRIGDQYGSSMPSVGGNRTTFTGVTLPATNDSLFRQLRDLKRDIKTWVGKYGIDIDTDVGRGELQANPDIEQGDATTRLTYLSLNEFGISMPVRNLYATGNIGKVFTGKVINAVKADKIFANVIKGQRIRIMYLGEGRVRLVNIATREEIIIEIAERS